MSGTKWIELGIRGVLIGLGALAIARGALLLLAIMNPRVWLSIALWMAAGSVVHDLAIAPASVLLGRVLRRPLQSPVTGNAVRAAWLGAGSVLLVGLPLVFGARHRANPTVIPGRPLLNLGLSLGLFVAGAVLVVGVSRVRARVRPPAPRPRPAAPGTPG